MIINPHINVSKSLYILALLAALCGEVSPARGQASQDAKDCSTVTVSCPSDISAYATLECSAYPNDPDFSYQWSVSAGVPSGSLNESSFSASGFLAGQPLTVTLVVNGRGAKCPHTVKTSVSISGLEARLIDRYNRDDSPAEINRALDKYVAALNNNAKAEAYIVVYPEQSARALPVQPRDIEGKETFSASLDWTRKPHPAQYGHIFAPVAFQQSGQGVDRGLTQTEEQRGDDAVRKARSLGEYARAYLIVRGIEPNRIKIQIGPSSSIWTVELYIVPPGADPPTLSSPSASAYGRPIQLWTLIYEQACKDLFGGEIAKRYYCIEATVDNPTNYKFQVDSIGFTAPGLSPTSAARSIIPTTSSPIINESILSGQRTSFRNRSLSIVKALGPVLTGVTPFFQNREHRANYLTLINILSNPVEKGLDALFPDAAINHLRNLNKMALHTTPLFMASRTQSKVVLFFPKGLLNLGKDDRSNLQVIRQKLGSAVVFGEFYSPVNPSFSLSPRPNVMPADYPVSGKVLDACGAGLSGVQVVLTGNGFSQRATITDQQGDYHFSNVPVGRTYNVYPKRPHTTFAPLLPGAENFLMGNEIVNLNFKSADSYLVAGVIRDSSGKPLENVEVNLSGSSSDTQFTNTSGEYSFIINSASGTGIFTITPTKISNTFAPSHLRFSLGCTNRKVDFKATKP
jgi:hypothetical protein